MEATINAKFLQVTIKGGSAKLVFETSTLTAGFLNAVKLTGEACMLFIETDQQELSFEEPTINNYYLNPETGEVSEPGRGDEL